MRSIVLPLQYFQIPVNQFTSLTDTEYAPARIRRGIKYIVRKLGYTGLRHIDPGIAPA